MKPAAIVTFSLVSLALATAPAAAGTKYQTNVVSANADAMTGAKIDPSLGSKSKVKISDKGQFQAKIDSLKDAGGVLVTTDGSWSDKVAPTLTGDEYMVVISGRFMALGVDFQFNLPIELKNGKGKAKIDASPLFSLIPGGTLRSSQQTTVEVYGPIGPGAVAGCTTNQGGGGFVLPPLPNDCLAGPLVGVGGVELQ